MEVGLTEVSIHSSLDMKSWREIIGILAMHPLERLIWGLMVSDGK